MSAPALQRLSKFVALTGVCSRREAEKWIHEGRITVNGAIVKTVAMSVASTDKIILDGMMLESNKTIVTPRLWAVYKMAGELVAQNDIKNRPTMFKRLEDLMGPTLRRNNQISKNTALVGDLKPISRLEYNAEGLCFLTDNGKLARLLDSSSEMRRQYRVRVHGAITDSKLSGIQRGMLVDGIKYQPMNVKVDRTANTISWMTIDTNERRPGAIKAIFKKLFLTPTRIICTGLGPYKSSEILPQGMDWAEIKLTPEVLKLFRQSV
jgi:23S rRNA pseudouridine2605 synthase